MSNTYRTLSQHLNDLKKENFSLKLRIYFLEERIQQKFEDSSDDIYRTNIELKVEVESLKQELQEKQQLLDKALTTAESLTNHNEAELQRRCGERQQEIDHMQQVLESKIQILQEEAQLARNEAERMASLAESHSQHPSVTMETVPKETSGDSSPQPDEDADRERIEQLSAALCCKERLIQELTEERTDLRQRVRLMEEQLQQLSASLLQKERDAQFYQEELGRERLRVQQEMQSLMEEQQSQLHQYERAAGQCVAELQKAQLQVESLQSQIHQSETSNKKLQEKVCDMESELLSIRQAAQNQQRTIQNLTDSLRTKDTETQELYHVIEDQNNTLCKLTETHQQQLQYTQAPEGAVDSGSLPPHSSLFSCQLELEASHRNHRLTQRRLEDLTRSRDRLQADLQDSQQHRETTHKHNQDLREMLEQLRSELQVKACALRDREAATRSEITDRDETIAQLQQSLRRKDTLLQEYSELLNRSSDSSGASERDALLHALRSRIRDRDAALERSIDEKFHCLEEKDDEVRRLQLVLREKDRDLERLRCVLNNTNDTITGLDALVRSKELELERTLETCRKLEWMKQQSDEKHTLAVRERDGVIQRLQTALHTHSKETEELRSVLLGKVSAADVLQELQAHLSMKERLFQEVMSDRSRQLQEHHKQLSELLDTISTRDQDMKDYGERLGRVISERSGQLQELRRQLTSREQELQDVNRERERDVSAARELQRLQNLLKEKDSFIQELLQGQSETLSSTAAAQAVCTSSSGEQEIQAIRDELQLTLKKQRETERELSELRSLLAAGHHDTLSSDQQCVLQQLVSEQRTLNEALRAEKSLYQSLRRVQSQADSSEKTRALHEQLDSLQALREQLEETLARSRETALAVDRATLVQADYGESSSDEDEEDPDSSSSEEFTDSIEDDDIKLTAQSLTSTQKAEEYDRPVMSQNASEGRRCDEAEQRNRDKCEMVEVTVQADDSSLAHVRNTLHEEREALNRRQPGLGVDEEPSVRSRGLEKHETDRRNSHEPQKVYRTFLEEEEEEEYDDEDGEEGEDVRAAKGKRGPPCVKLREGRWKRRCTRPHSLDLGALLSHTPAAPHTAQ
ncbi:hypothetical protein ABG768_013749, partial [Culter alburnus]